jgi:hypothetical protein
MATVLEEYTTEKQNFSAFFLWAKWLNAKNINKETFPVYDGKCLSRKAVHKWVEKFSQGRSKVTDDDRPGRPVEILKEASGSVKRLLCCGFRSTGKEMGQVYQCWWRICREINIFSSLEYHMCHVLYPLATYLLTLPRYFCRSDCDLNSVNYHIWEYLEVTYLEFNKIANDLIQLYIDRHYFKTSAFQFHRHVSNISKMKKGVNKRMNSKRVICNMGIWWEVA